MKSFRVATLLFVLCFCLPQVSLAMDRFAQVDTDLFRGSQPETQADFQLLKDQGFRLVINLGNNPKEIEFERTQLEALGIQMISQPLSVYSSPDKTEIEEVLKQMRLATASQKTYVHCRQGKDRTGMIVALYRVHYQDWSPLKACVEMYKFGFNVVWVRLEKFFWFHTNPNSLDL